MLPDIFATTANLIYSLGRFIVKNIVPIAILTTAAVTSYSFLYKRPELILEVKQSVSGSRGPDEDGDADAVIMLLLANVGNSSASDVQLTITADAFKFDNDIDATDSIVSDYEPPQAVMEIRSGRKSGFIGGGRRHDIYLENVVYEGDVQELWLGKTIFNEGRHDLKYQISCREHGPRRGKISFKVEDGDVRITNRRYPTHRRQLKTWILGRVERTRTQELENLDKDDVEFQYEVN
ncbi:hypothetical protein [Halosimplex pelagicum]|uniref:Uncharacterized protein n=1 Tax=Halosimplex pelagicum TaxID=869886 RepID=A0A7D5TED5_9EURY|nr:hypothetical protein [Halosimplex pelagicum]QLH83795.1 hypothetical protein HZS54_20130 [Halosimplex pelagicum]